MRTLLPGPKVYTWVELSNCSKVPLLKNATCCCYIRAQIHNLMIGEKTTYPPHHTSSHDSFKGHEENLTSFVLLHVTTCEPTVCSVLHLCPVTCRPPWRACWTWVGASNETEPNPTAPCRSVMDTLAMLPYSPKCCLNTASVRPTNPPSHSTLGSPGEGSCESGRELNDNFRIITIMIIIITIYNAPFI